MSDPNGEEPHVKETGRKEPRAKEQRNTRQRASLMEALGSLEHFVSVKGLIALLRERGESVSQPTVYRAVQMLTAAGELDALRTADGETLYRKCRTGSHHHHLVCRVCGRTEEIESTAVEAWAEQVAKAHGFTAATHTLEVFGTCAGCSSSRESAVSGNGSA